MTKNSLEQNPPEAGPCHLRKIYENKGKKDYAIRTSASSTEGWAAVLRSNKFRLRKPCNNQMNKLIGREVLRLSLIPYQKLVAATTMSVPIDITGI